MFIQSYPLEEVATTICRRPLKVKDASLVVTAETITAVRRGTGLISLAVQPLDDEPATMELLPDPMHIIDVDTQPVEVGTKSPDCFTCLVMSQGRHIQWAGGQHTIITLNSNSSMMKSFAR